MKNLEERQKREVERLNHEIKILIEADRITGEDRHGEYIMNKDLALSYVTHAPEAYFKILDEQE